jgi:hypothetical protein
LSTQLPFRRSDPPVRPLTKPTTLSHATAPTTEVIGPAPAPHHADQPFIDRPPAHADVRSDSLTSNGLPHRWPPPQRATMIRPTGPVQGFPPSLSADPPLRFTAPRDRSYREWTLRSTCTPSLLPRENRFRNDLQLFHPLCFPTRPKKSAQASG